MTEDNNILNFAVRRFDAFEKAVSKQWADFCRETGCKVALRAVAMDLPELHQSLLTDKGLQNGQWDLAHISSDWMTEACMGKALTAIDDFAGTPDYFNAWPDSLLRSQRHEGQYFGIPFHDGPECLIFRKDLFEDPQHQYRFFSTYGYALQPPANWAAYRDVARYFQQPEKHLYGTVFAGYPDGHNAVYDFCIQTWTRGGDFLTSGGAIDFQQSAVLEGLAYYRSLAGDASAVHPESIEMESVALGSAFAKGELAMMINWFGFASYVASSADSPLKGKIGVAPVPHQPNGRPVSPNSYWVIGIGAGSRHQQLAFDFIRYATGPEKDVEITLDGAVGCRKSTWKDTRVNQRIPFFHALESLHEHVRELPQSADWPEIARIIDNMMSQAIGTDLPVATIAAAAQQHVTGILIN